LARFGKPLIESFLKSISHFMWSPPTPLPPPYLFLSFLLSNFYNTIVGWHFLSNFYTNIIGDVIQIVKYHPSLRYLHFFWSLPSYLFLWFPSIQLLQYHCWGCHPSSQFIIHPSVTCTSSDPLPPICFCGFLLSNFYNTIVGDVIQIVNLSSILRLLCPP
jgi:hypothetical protein